jgi:hypothetical protein
MLCAGNEDMPRCGKEVLAKGEIVVETIVGNVTVRVEDVFEAAEMEGEEGIVKVQELVEKLVEEEGI